MTAVHEADTEIYSIIHKSLSILIICHSFLWSSLMCK